MTHAEFLRDPSRAGVYRLPERGSWIVRASKSNGFALWRVDLAEVRDKPGLLTALSRSLGFPDWFGGNWDALQDCLGDLSWKTSPGYVVVVEHCQEIAKRAPAEFGTLLEVLGATADYWREQRIPFWAFVGGVSQGLRDLSQGDKRG